MGFSVLHLVGWQCLDPFFYPHIKPTLFGYPFALGVNHLGKTSFRFLFVPFSSTSEQYRLKRRWRESPGTPSAPIEVELSDLNRDVFIQRPPCADRASLWYSLYFHEIILCWRDIPLIQLSNRVTVFLRSPRELAIQASKSVLIWGPATFPSTVPVILPRRSLNV